MYHAKESRVGWDRVFGGQQGFVSTERKLCPRCGSIVWDGSNDVIADLCAGPSKMIIGMTIKCSLCGTKYNQPKENNK